MRIQYRYHTTDKPILIIILIGRLVIFAVKVTAYCWKRWFFRFYCWIIRTIVDATKREIYRLCAIFLFWFEYSCAYDITPNTAFKYTSIISCFLSLFKIVRLLDWNMAKNIPKNRFITTSGVSPVNLEWCVPKSVRNVHFAVHSGAASC